MYIFNNFKFKFFCLCFSFAMSSCSKQKNEDVTIPKTQQTTLPHSNISLEIGTTPGGLSAPVTLSENTIDKAKPLVPSPDVKLALDSAIQKHNTTKQPNVTKSVQIIQNQTVNLRSAERLEAMNEFLRFRTEQDQDKSGKSNHGKP